ncbi:MAG: hypothetical protein PT958_02265, partial [Firmicutes bacterium]|nr:hypothetical protein [Bacillota bacterium]
QMSCGKWYPQSGRRYLAKAECPEHGTYVIRLRFEHEAEGSVKVCRLVYDETSELAKNFDEERKKKPRRSRSRRRRRPAREPQQ